MTSPLVPLASNDLLDILGEDDMRLLEIRGQVRFYESIDLIPDLQPH